jgi:3alpha(or 20beta)-hydroxysteroid dehydrogenase
VRDFRFIQPLGVNRIIPDSVPLMPGLVEAACSRLGQAMTAQEARQLRVIITGGARGIGAATARLLANDGAQVLVCDVLDDEGQQFADSLGENVLYRHLDVTNEREWAAAVATAEKHFGSLNALFNNAGVLGLGSVTECSAQEFRRIIEINLTGAYLGIRSVAPALAAAGGGVIVNTSSTAGLQGYAGLAPYVASKWGLRGLTKAAAIDLARDRIRVLSLHPGPIHTPMTANMPEDVAAAQPIPRFGEPEEVARMARFMLIDATFSTGSEFVIDGGATAGQALVLEQVHEHGAHA